jgi:hypothetical protein
MQIYYLSTQLYVLFSIRWDFVVILHAAYDRKDTPGVLQFGVNIFPK